MVRSQKQCECGICFDYWKSRDKYMEGYLYLINGHHIPDAHSSAIKTDKCHKHEAEIAKLKETVEELKHEKSKLEEAKDALAVDKARLKERVDQLKQELAGCKKADNQRVGTENAALANDKENLESDITALTAAKKTRLKMITRKLRNIIYCHVDNDSSV